MFEVILCIAIVSMMVNLTKLCNTLGEIHHTLEDIAKDMDKIKKGKIK